MLNESLINPRSIVVVGGSNHLEKPGGNIIRNLKDGRFKGEILVINPGNKRIQDLATFSSPSEIKKEIDLAILAIPAKICLKSIKDLHRDCNTRSFIIISAGFSEIGVSGEKIEEEIVEYARQHAIHIFGPNCTGIITPHFSGSFTTPIPEYHLWGADLISSSGATAVFLMEQGIQQGLRFKNVFSVGNAMMIGVEDVLEYLDQVYSHKSNKVIVLYVESIRDPVRLQRHALSLYHKGCQLVALKAGKTASGSMAAASHTGAIANSYDAVESLFLKSKIVPCSSRNELINAALVARLSVLKEKNIAVVTHAGGPGVVAADALETQGFSLHQPGPSVSGKLLDKLPEGASVKNPFDILATAGVKEVKEVLNYIRESKCYDGIIVIFGSPGLFDEREIFEFLSEQINILTLPLYTVIPSPINTKKEIEQFITSGQFYFRDETDLVNAIKKVFDTQHYPLAEFEKKQTKFKNKGEFLPQNITNGWLHSAGFTLVKGIRTNERNELFTFFRENKPVVLKTADVIHKTEVGGVKMNLTSEAQLDHAIDDISKKNGEAYIIQQQINGFELYLGVKYDETLGHILYFGKGGIDLEIEQDINCALLPINEEEISYLLARLRCSRIWEGHRNRKGIDLQKLTSEIIRLNTLVNNHPEIKELDVNPLICSDNQCIIVDSRIVV